MISDFICYFIEVKKEGVKVVDDNEDKEVILVFFSCDC
jgi:hypothetical protein